MPVAEIAQSDPEPSDTDPTARARAGDPAALAELYHRYARSLFATAYRLLASKEDAEDVVHDVFVGLPEALRRYDERGKLGAWLTRVTVRVALSALRRDRAISDERIQRSDAEEGSVDHESRISLADAVAALPPSLRTVLVLKEIEGFTHSEIATTLGISKGASEVRLHRAVAALRAALTRGDHT